MLFEHTRHTSRRTLGLGFASSRKQRSNFFFLFWTINGTPLPGLCVPVEGSDFSGTQDCLSSVTGEQQIVQQRQLIRDLTAR